MESYWLRSICFFALINIHQCADGKHSMHKNFNGFSPLAMRTEENTKEVRHFSKVFCKQQHYSKKVKTNKRFQKYSKISQKEFNMHTLNRPFVRRTRSSKIGTAPLHKLQKDQNK
jgi:hypothetical protein